MNAEKKFLEGAPFEQNDVVLDLYIWYEQFIKDFYIWPAIALSRELT